MDDHANDHTTSISPSSGVLGFDRLAQLLGSWQKHELHAARGFPECRGLSHAQLEDLYQDTALALLSRRYASEEHLRNALRHGIRHRALNMHRDQRRRRQILAEHAPAMHRTAQAAQTPPEDAALAQQDRLIAKEFLAELEPLERQVFALTAEGLRYRAIATALAIPANQARTAARSCERKRARFQLLYETGRLCGYRAATIELLQGGALAGIVEQQARAHLAACPACRSEQTRLAPGVDRTRGEVVVILTAALLAGCRWVRRLTGSGGVGIKATAVVFTAAVVAGSTLGVSRHRARPAERPRAPTGTPVPRGALPPASPLEARAPLGTLRRRSPPEKARAAADSATVTTQPPTVAAVQVGASMAPVSADASAAEREFGPEW